MNTIPHSATSWGLNAEDETLQYECDQETNSRNVFKGIYRPRSSDMVKYHTLINRNRFPWLDWAGNPGQERGTP